MAISLDICPRQIFKQQLFKLIEMKLDLSKTELSNFDIKRGLKLPLELNENLAEDIGIMIGDGHIGKDIRPKKAVDYQIIYSGNAITDKKYFSDYIRKLKFDLYGLDFPVAFVGKNKSEIRLKINSKGLVDFYTKVICLPINKKRNISIPSIIWTDKLILKSCLRGIVDTDFSFDIKYNKYPVLKLKTQSKNLVEDCKKAFSLIGLNSSIKTDVIEIHSKTKRPYKTNYLYLNGKDNFKKYIQEIGFKNLKNIKKLKKLNGPTGTFAKKP